MDGGAAGPLHTVPARASAAAPGGETGIACGSSSASRGVLSSCDRKQVGRIAEQTDARFSFAVRSLDPIYD